MENNVEHELCNNCKKEIPQPNYVMHTMHCARNITLCKVCKEPIPKAQFSAHEKTCRKPVEPKPLPPPTNLERSSYFQTRKAVEDKKVEARKERYMQKMDRLVDTGHSFRGDSAGRFSRESSLDYPRDQPSNNSRDIPNSYGRDLPNTYGRDIPINYGRGHPNNYGRDLSNSYGRDYSSNFGRDISNSFGKETSNTYGSRETSNTYGREMTNNYARESSVESSSRSRFSNNYNTTNTNEIKQNGIQNRRKPEPQKVENRVEENVTAAPPPPAPAPLPPLIKRSEPKSSGMLACKYCDLELPKLELEEHENYCGSRTDKCLECGELVMFKDKQMHMDSTHAGVKRRGGQRTAGWDSSTQREDASGIRERPSRAIRPMAEFDYDPMPYLPAAYQAPGGGAKKKEGESYKDLSRRLDCPSFQPPPQRRRNPPTELVIPCEFCNVPIPHEDLVQHETGCRPDLARYNPRRRSSPEDDYYTEPRQASVDEEDLPCEFCGDMIPASQLYSHQIRCT